MQTSASHLHIQGSRSYFPMTPLSSNVLNAAIYMFYQTAVAASIPHVCACEVLSGREMQERVLLCRFAPGLSLGHLHSQGE